MPEYDNELSGVLFKNDRKTTDKHPDYNGTCQIDGQQYRMAAWLKDSREGKKFLNFKFTKDDGQYSKGGKEGGSQKSGGSRPKQTQEDFV